MLSPDESLYLREFVTNECIKKEINFRKNSPMGRCGERSYPDLYYMETEDLEEYLNSNEEE